MPIDDSPTQDEQRSNLAFRRRDAADLAGESHDQVVQLAQRYLDVPEASLETRLRRDLGEGSQLVEEILSLLRAERDSGEFLSMPSANMVAAALSPSSWQDATIGRYRVVACLGRGGMGTVYLAERADSEFEKLVAIKVAEYGFAPRLAELFRRERKILAQLTHPNIAALLDAGTISAAPYFVMEYVDGVPIDAYCEDLDLGVRARLRIFRRVCSAVEYAHRSLVVHRDIKPANILVTADGEPKLLDFGIAKLMNPGEDGEETIGGSLRLTPSSASPEQLLGLPITTSSDVYSLGVVLYRLLTGVAPRSFNSLSLDSVRGVFHREVLLPSRNGIRASEGGVVRRSISRDLDAIVLKALAPDRTDRYGTVAELVDELDALRDGRPVAARGPSKVYTAVRFVHRHRIATSALLVLAFITAAFLGITVVNSRELQLQQAQAEAHQVRTEKVAAFLTQVLSAADPRYSGDSSLSVRTALDRGLLQLETEPAGDPLVEAMLRDALGSIYLRIGEYRQAEKLLYDSLRRKRTLGTSSAAQIGDSYRLLGSLAIRQGDFQRGISLLNIAQTALADRVPTEQDQIEFLHGMAWAKIQLGRYEEAERDLYSAMAILTSRDDLWKGRNHRLLGNLYLARGEMDAAQKVLQTALEDLRRLGSQADVADVLEDLGSVALHRLRLVAAREYIRSASELHVRLYGERSMARARTLALEARLELLSGSPSQARRLAEQCMELTRNLLGPFGTTYVIAAEVRARSFLAEGQLDAASEGIRELLSFLTSQGLADNAFAARLHDGLGDIAWQRQDWESTEKHYRNGLRVRLNVFETPHYLIAASQERLASCLYRQGRRDEALQFQRAAAQNRDPIPDPRASNLAPVTAPRS